MPQSSDISPRLPEPPELEPQYTQEERRALLQLAHAGDARAGELLDEAAEAAERYGLGAVARKVAALRAQSGSPV